MATYTVTGADKDTGRAIKMRVRAASEDEARASCNDDGILVSSVADEVAAGGMSDEQLAFRRATRTLEHRVLMHGIMWGVVRGLAMWSLICAIIGMLFWLLTYSGHH